MVGKGDRSFLFVWKSTLKTMPKLEPKGRFIWVPGISFRKWKQPGCLGCIGVYILPSYNMDYFIKPIGIPESPLTNRFLVCKKPGHQGASKWREWEKCLDLETRKKLIPRCSMALVYKPYIWAMKKTLVGLVRGWNPTQLCWDYNKPL